MKNILNTNIPKTVEEILALSSYPTNSFMVGFFFTGAERT